MIRLRTAGVLTAAGAVAALCAWNGAGGAVISRWKTASTAPASNALTQAKAQRSGIADIKSHRHPVTRLIPPDLLLVKSGLDPTLDEADSGALEESLTSRSARGRHAGRNVFVNDPCLDPAPTAPFPSNFLRTVQSETDIAVLNASRHRNLDDRSDDHDRSGYDWAGGSSYRGEGSGHDRGDHDDCDHDGEDDNDHRHRDGRLMVAGYNNSRGRSDNRQGFSGFSYSTDGGREWIDGGGLPPLVPSGAPPGTAASDAYFGDPVVVVHHRTKLFYYASLYQTPEGFASLSVNRGKFEVAPQQVPVESKANTRCENNPGLHGIPDPPALIRERIIWERPVAAVLPPFLGQQNDAFLDKEWLYVDQRTGFLYLTYTRFGADGSTPLELVRSFDGGRTWTPPTIIVPNLLDTFNQATQIVVTPTGRVVVAWLARTFTLDPIVEREQRIEIGVSDDGGTTFGPPIVVARVNPQASPQGYNRLQLLNAPHLAVDKGRDDGVTTRDERERPGFGNVYLTYFHGKTPLAPAPNPPPMTFARAAHILLSTSSTNGATWEAPVKVNDDTTDTSHVFPSVQVNDKGEIFVTWIDRRVDPANNLLNDTYGDISDQRGRRTGPDLRITDVSTDWITREDIQPDFGDYNSSEVIGFRHFLSIWADGRFPTPAPLMPAPPPAPPGTVTRPSSQSATPDSLMAVIGRGG
jgi:hypothetical protein